MRSLAIFGIVGDMQAGLSSTARNSLGCSAGSEKFITTVLPGPACSTLCSAAPSLTSRHIPGADSFRTFVLSLSYLRSLLLLPPRHTATRTFALAESWSLHLRPLPSPGNLDHYLHHSLICCSAPPPAAAPLPYNTRVAVNCSRQLTTVVIWGHFSRSTDEKLETEL